MYVKNMWQCYMISLLHNIFSTYACTCMYCTLHVQPNPPINNSDPNPPNQNLNYKKINPPPPIPTPTTRNLQPTRKPLNQKESPTLQKKNHLQPQQPSTTNNPPTNNHPHLIPTQKKRHTEAKIPTTTVCIYVYQIINY